MAGICEGRVVIVTGAGRGIGRAHALAFAEQGARVVVNDLGAEVDGSGSSTGPAGEVVDHIRSQGGAAIANGDDVASWEGAQRLINAAIESFGRLDVVVNNAGILRDRMLVNMTESEWDDVIRVHLKGTFAMTRWAAAYFREQAKAGVAQDARIINTTSASGIYGNVGQANYGAAKAGIASLTIIAAMELARYGVTVNAIAPVALTRMTENLGIVAPDDRAAQAELAPENIAPLVVWLGSTHSAGITGRVFDVAGHHIDVAEGWHAGPSAEARGQRFTVDELDDVVPALVRAARRNADMSGHEPPEAPNA
ncbi:short-chain dehydrogenase/reductase SDR [Acidimicrobium ferrooxidans DSM 10331]|uniref:Short-chain dehydrogenase/reductase SDR n=1 Tax=Acidimicrobium ferrooxidans (strain DSM 10331 / JCM 15462 / NBRC 103882 / ICP) TaxID=525909 RepID=C7M059_ACIFD|nr:SDR family oxidoreductase [Acidimicrobium ferrooxidans]ACU54367.1 short-chain dehydrogenase/reductase SDR [Acidimicrobium ferrooxidans DSM 10331]